MSQGILEINPPALILNFPSSYITPLFDVVENVLDPPKITFIISSAQVLPYLFIISLIHIHKSYSLTI